MKKVAFCVLGSLAILMVSFIFINVTGAELKAAAKWGTYEKIDAGGGYVGVCRGVASTCCVISK